MFEFKTIMNNIKNLEWKKYFYKNLLICSLVIFFIFFVITVVLTGGYTRAVNNELNRYCFEVSFNVKDRINRILDIFTDSYSDIAGANASDMTIAACSHDMTTEIAVKSVFEIKKLISTYKSDSGYVDSIFIYFPKSDYIISSNSRFSCNYADYFIDTAWISEYKKTGKLMNIRTVKNGKLNKTYFTVIKPVNSGGETNLIAYNIDINGFFGSINADLREFYIIDEDDNVVYGKDSDLTGKKLKYAGKSGERILNSLKSRNVEENNSENVILTSFSTDDNSHRFVIGIDSSGYNMQHKRIRNTLFFIMFIAVFLTVILAFFIVSEFYNNILDLVMVIDGKERKSKRSFREVAFVKNKILKMLDKNAMIETELANRINVVSKTKMDNLQGQLNSHFLYNTLGLISAIDILEHRRDTDTVKAIHSLSDILRFALSRESYTVPLAEELIFMRKYLDIQRLRYKDKFEYIEEVDETVKDLNVIKMIIQPLLENAVFHGIAPMGGKGVLSLRIFIDNDMLKIQVSDNGAGMTEEKMEQLRSEFKKGIDSSNIQTHGLLSVNQRCMLFYGEEYGCEIESCNGVTTVTVKHPILEGQTDN